MAKTATVQVRKAGALKGGRPDRLERKQRRRQNLAVALLALCLMGVALLHVWLRLQVVHMGYALSTTSKLQNQLEQESRELKVELATLTSPDRLEAMARKRLGLAPPEKGQVIVLP
ncbi:MAG TPA: cell division protein FtsL [Candidatus Acidoferrales bacterium]|jgi:cell division protein FtsL|nr:cell division protein FtsL [Candidatus Acidoferrales bacterium]